MTLPSNDNPKIRETVAKTFMEMLKNMPYEAITIPDVIETANVSQADFDRNYTSKRSIIMDFLAHLQDEASHQIAPQLPAANVLFNEKNLLKILTYYQQYKEELLAIDQAGLSNLLYDMTCLLTEDLLTMSEDADYVERFRLFFMTGGLLSTFMQWLHSENPVTIEEFATTQYKMVSQSLEIPLSFK
ncbi:hypothetical protein [Limosilactobacillus ingluviei]|uniref:hypothetical protein n=1 Tax=Limosilactobacillus ingluviei TaxID=148604 RepID=UPI00195DA710|nr:hypothetical protein [Limosilactobacillus ingluviei]MBM6729274.1 hypothetical protein [Limosilactobacillus ingluviei]